MTGIEQGMAIGALMLLLMALRMHIAMAMLVAAKPIGEFVDQHPSVKVLALAVRSMATSMPFSLSLRLGIPWL